MNVRDRPDFDARRFSLFVRLFSRPAFFDGAAALELDERIDDSLPRRPRRALANVRRQRLHDRPVVVVLALLLLGDALQGVDGAEAGFEIVAAK